MHIKIISTPLGSPEKHEADVNEYLELGINCKYKVDTFVTAGYGGYSKYQTESAKITTIITMEE